MYKRLGLIVVLSLVIIVLAAGCGPKKAEFDVEMQDFSFAPSEYKVPAGAEVTLNLDNTGTLVHEFVVMKLGTAVSIPFSDDDEGNIFWEKEVDPGQSTTVTFTAPTEPGIYQLVCGTEAHLEQGMLGTFEVTK